MCAGNVPMHCDVNKSHAYTEAMCFSRSEQHITKSDTGGHQVHSHQPFASTTTQATLTTMTSARTDHAAHSSVRARPVNTDLDSVVVRPGSHLCRVQCLHAVHLFGSQVQADLRITCRRIAGSHYMYFAVMIIRESQPDAVRLSSRRSWRHV